MPTSIYKYDGTLLTTVADSTLDSTHSTLRFPGRGYQNYGEPIMENFVWMLQNFAGTTAPTLPLSGQCWYDTNTSTMKIYNGVSWTAAGGVIINASQPASGSSLGDFWYDSVNLQLNTWNGTSWDLVGPLGSVGNDPLSPAVPANSSIDALRLSDGSTTHKCWRITVGGTVLAIISKDSEFIPAPSIPGFSSVKPGINFNTDILNIGVSGDSKAFTSDKTNMPATDNTYDLGASNMRFANIFSLNGVISSRLAVNAAVSSYNLDVNGTSLFRNTAHFVSNTDHAGMKMLSGNLMVTPEVGAVEFDGSNFYFTSRISGTPTRFALTPGASGNFTNSVTISSNTQSTSSSTGALVVSGGTGIGGNLHVGGNIIVTGTSDQIVAASGDSAARPGYSWNDSRFSGLFSPAANIVAISTASTERVRINENGAIGLGGANYGTAGQVITSAGSGSAATWSNIGVIPSGGLIPYAVPGTAPAGFLLCDGSTYNIATYPTLGGLLGSTYGGDGITTFAVPDLRGRVPAGVDNMGGTAANRLTSTVGMTATSIGNVGGLQTHTLSVAEMPSHRHQLVTAGYGSTTLTGTGFLASYYAPGNNNNTYMSQLASPEPTLVQSGLTGGSSAHRNVQPTIVLNYLIKT